MLVAVTCPVCRHRGHVPGDMLPRSLCCSQCGSRARFDSGESSFQSNKRSKADQLARTRGMLFERVQLPDDLARLLWDKHY